MIHHFQAGEAAKKLAMRQVLVRYLIIVTGLSGMIIYQLAQQQTVSAPAVFTAFGILTVLLGVSFLFAIRKAKRAAESFLLSLDEEGLAVERGASKAHVKFAQVSHIVKRRDGGLVVYLENRRIPFLLLTRRIENFELLEELLGAKVKIVDSPSNGTGIFFNRYFWMISGVGSMLVFMVSFNLVVVLVSGGILLTLLGFSAWQVWSNRKNMQVGRSIVSLLFLLLVIVFKIVVLLKGMHF